MDILELIVLEFPGVLNLGVDRSCCPSLSMQGVNLLDFVMRWGHFGMLGGGGNSAD